MWALNFKFAVYSYFVGKHGLQEKRDFPLKLLMLRTRGKEGVGYQPPYPTIKVSELNGSTQRSQDKSNQSVS